MRYLPLFLLIAILFSACQSSTPSPVPQLVPTITPAPAVVPTEVPVDIVGRVIDLDGNPIAGARAESATALAISDSQGYFKLVRVKPAPQWVTVTRAGFLSRTRAASPNALVLFRLTPDDGKTIVIHFVGDTMFGRRFFDPNEDGDTSDGLLPVNPTAADHLALLAPIQPLLSNANLTAINFEGPLSDQPYISPRNPRPQNFHPTKPYVFTNHPSALQALEQAGVDVVDIGNNHIYDALEEGVAFTIQKLEQSGLKFFGAGTSETAAWKPSIVHLRGQTIAFIGCTTIEHMLGFNDMIPYTASDALGKSGSALCEGNALRNAIAEAQKESDFVIVMIHGSVEYSRVPSDLVMRYVNIAKEAGVKLIITHHSHAVGGLVWDGTSLTDNGLGNFIFDQTIWPTFESYLLAVTLREGKIIRVYTEPLIVEDYVAKGLTGEMADYVARGVAGRVPGPLVMENGAVEMDFGNLATTYTFTPTLEGGEAPGMLFQIPEGKWLSSCNGARDLRLGRDLLWIGSFENQAVESTSKGPLLWMPSEGVEFGKAFAFQGDTGLRITRGSSNRNDAVTTHLHRVLVKAGDQLTVDGMVRASAGALVSLHISWYPDTKGLSSSVAGEMIKIDAPDTWQSFHLDVEVPPGIVATGIFLRLAPPAKGASTADFDNLRLIQWAPQGSAFSPLYDYAQITGTCQAALKQQFLPGGLESLTP